MFDSKAEERFFEQTGAIKNDVKFQATDTIDDKSPHIPDACYYDQRVNGIVFLNYKAGNFPKSIGKTSGARAANLARRKYVENDYKPLTRARLNHANANMGWSNSMWQGKTFVESVDNFYYFNRVYYLIVCDGIHRKCKTDAKVKKSVDQWLGFGSQYKVMDKADFQEWVNSPYVEPYHLSSFIPNIPFNRAHVPKKKYLEVYPENPIIPDDGKCPFHAYEQVFQRLPEKPKNHV
ncbi:hypothetical protein VCRA2128O305_10059 [Vibrio crassostreae]|uniref:hypothetical protein n=1 Tax=Vibrio crassostreae TaxID=246167 RepID=UPI0005E4F6D0|nr:hypothetical protein [Vibrio crassostreae]RPF10738.1 hypothetical protein EDB14_1830 [Vibrio crassostreae]TCT67638.1 hypothetical protein EDB44_101686 [Vibrio crassostreae]TCT86931.1 hypothetical protein EDB43_10156 [Vibrio crassostreae]TCU07890.1 hypothetical protein EDB47_10256 [Vibrio crassostreae]TDW13296.1 hypothetical protein EDB45_10155 [Vibrio crassostreae]